MMRALLLVTLMLTTVSADGQEMSLRSLQGDGASLSGVLVHAGAADAKLAIEVAKASPMLVLVLTQESGVDAVRAAVSAERLSGQVTVRALGRSIPLVDNVAAAVILEGGVELNAEAKRVLGARGKLLEAGKEPWIKPVPESYDDWPQYFYDGAASDVSQDTAVGPVRGIQWQAGTINQRLFGTEPQVGLRVAGGLVLHSTRERLLARDVRSGLPVWERRDITVSHPNRYAFLADAKLGRVWLLPRFTDRQADAAAGPRYLHMLDLNTGKTLAQFDQGLDFAMPEGQELGHGQKSRADDAQVRLEGRHLVMVTKADLAVLDAATGKRLWGKTLDDAEFWTPVVSDGVTYVVEGPSVRSMSYTHWPMGRVKRITAYDNETGKVKWSHTPATGEERISSYNMTLDHGELAAVARGESPDGKPDGARLLILDAATGRQRHYINLKRGGGLGKGHSHIRVMAHSGYWMINEISAGIMLPFKSPADESTWLKPFAGLRPAACQVWRATPQYLIGAATLADLENKVIHDNSASRTSCDIGSFPAEGLLLQGENSCWCKPYLPGLNAMHSQNWQATADADRLTRGKATAATAPPTSDDQWPQYMQSPWRGNWNAATTLGKGDLAPAWTIEPEPSAAHEALRREWGDLMIAQGPSITGVSVAEGTAVYARVAQGEVVAVDPATGKPRWRAGLDGRIDSQPTIHQGLVLVGTHAGTVHALNRDTGELVWRYQVAPSDAMICVNGQLASPWPVHGAITTLPQGVLATAGRHTEMDGGIHWVVLDPRTGSVQAKGVYTTDSQAIRGPWGHNTGTTMPPVTDGRHVFYSNREYTFDGQAMQRFQFDDKDPALQGRMDGQDRTWRRGWLAPVLMPGIGTLIYGLPGEGYHATIWGGSYARQFVYKPGQADYLNMGGVTSGKWKGRGGDSTEVVARMKRFDELQPIPDNKNGKLGAEKLWEHSYQRGIGDTMGIRVAVASSQRVLVGVIYSGLSDAWKRAREKKPMHKLDVLDWDTGKPLQEDLPLPAPPMIGGISVAGGRAYVACDDGSIVCLESR